MTSIPTSMCIDLTSEAEGEQLIELLHAWRDAPPEKRAGALKLLDSWFAEATEDVLVGELAKDGRQV